MKKLFLVPVLFLVFTVMLCAESGNTAAALGIGMKFPVFTARDLNDANVTVPDPVTPKVEIAVMTFSRQDMAITDSWINTAAAKYKDNPGFTYHEVAVIPDMLFISGIILNGIKGAVPQDRWGNFLVFSGDKDKIVKDFSADDQSLFYVFVVGKDGEIKWSARSASPAASDIQGLVDSVSFEINPVKKPVKK